MGLLTDDIRKAYFQSGEWRVHLYRKGRDIGVDPVDPAWNFAGGTAATARYMWAFDNYTQFDEIVVGEQCVRVRRRSARRREPAADLQRGPVWGMPVQS